MAMQVEHKGFITLGFKGFVKGNKLLDGSTGREAP